MLNHSDLEKMDIKKLGHQELVLEAVDLLRSLRYTLDTENLQSMALQLGCKGRNVIAEIQMRQGENDQNRANLRHGELHRKRLSITVLSYVADLLTTLKNLVSWLDRAPFEGIYDICRLRNLVVKLGLELVTVTQRESACVDPEGAIVKSCRKLIEYCDGLVQNTKDPLVIQPAALEQATIRKKQGEELGMNIQSAYNGIHGISSIKDLSPADMCSKIEKGDEVLQVNGQTVLGWQLKELVKILKDKPKEVTLLLKKRPRHINPLGAMQNHKKLAAKHAQQVATLPKSLKKRRSREGEGGKTGRTSLLVAVTAAGEDAYDNKDTLDTGDADGNDTDNDVFRSGSESPQYTLPVMPDAKQRRATVSGGSPTLERNSLMVEDSVIPSKSQVLNRAHREATLAVLAASENNLQWRVEGGEEGASSKGDKVWRKTSSESSSGQKGPSESEMEDSVFSSDKEDKDQQCPSKPAVEKKSQEFRVTKPTPVVVELTPDPTPPPKPPVRRTSSSSSISSTTSSSTLISSPCTAPKLKPPDILPKPKLKPPSVEAAPRSDPSAPVRKTSASSKSPSPSPSSKKSFTPFFSRESKKSSSKSKGGSENGKKTTTSAQSVKIKSNEKASESRVSSSSETSWYVGGFVSADKLPERQSVDSTAPADLSDQSKIMDRKTSDLQTDRSSKDSIKKTSDSKGDSNFQASANPVKNSSESQVESKTKDSTQKKPACPAKPTKVSIKKKPDTKGGKTSKDSIKKNCESQGEKHSKDSGVASDIPAEQAQTKDSVRTLLETARGDVQSEDKPQPTIPSGSMQVHHALTMQASVVASDSATKDMPQLTKVKKLDSPKPSEVASGMAESISSVKQKKRVEFSSDTKDCSTGEEASHKSSPEKTQISDQSSKESSPVKMRQRSSSRRQGMTDRRVSCKDLGQGDCEGWLLKKREKDRILSKDWTKRWCVLKSHNFYYYKHKEDLRAEGVIYLQAFQVTPAEDLKKTKKFAFKVHNAGTTFYFASERQDDMSKWMNKLGLAAINFESKETVTTGGFFKPGLRSNYLNVPNAYYSESDEDPEEVAAQVENSLREASSEVASKVTTSSQAEIKAKVTESSQPDVGAKVVTSKAEVDAKVTISQPDVDIKVTTSSQPDVNAKVTTSSQPEVNAQVTTLSQPEVNAKVTTSSQPEVNAKVTTSSQPAVNAKVTTSSQPEVHTTKSTQKETVIKVITPSQGNNGNSSVATTSSSSDSHSPVPGQATQVTASPHSPGVPDNQPDNTPDNPVVCDETDQGPPNASEPMAATGGVKEPEAPSGPGDTPATQGDEMDTVLRAIHSQDLTIDGVDRRKRRTRHMSSVVGLVEGNNDANVLKLRKLLALKRTLKMKEQDVQDIDRLLASQPTASRLRDFVYHHHDLRL